MKKIIFLILLTSCSFKAEKNTLDVNYLNVNDLTVGKYNFKLNNKN